MFFSKNKQVSDLFICILLFTLILFRSYFEYLANEIIYEIFEYLDVYHGFFYLNNRFKNLLINSNLPFQINISNLSKTNLELYHEHMINPNRHRINILRLSNPFIVDLVFSPPRTICDFIQLERMSIQNIFIIFSNI